MPIRALMLGVSLMALAAAQAQAQSRVDLDEISVAGNQGAAQAATQGSAQATVGPDGSPVVLRDPPADGAPQAGGAPGVVATRGYTPVSGRTATKTDTPILETPQSVSVVTRQQLEDRQPQNLLEAVAYSPGAVTGIFGFDPRYDAFKIRGIDVTYTGVFRDGLRQINSPNGLFRLEPYGLEAITILRGPAASIYGASSSGGIVDLISKRPLFLPLREINLQTGSFGRIQGSFDLSGPLEDAPTVAYRLTGLVRSAGTEIGAVQDDRVFIAPALTWRPDSDTKLTLLAEYMNALTGGTAAYINTYDPLTGTSTGATRQFAGDRRFNDFIQDQGRIGYEFEHRLSDFVVLNQRVRFSALATNQEYVFARFPGRVLEDTSGTVGDTFLDWRFSTGPIEHQLITGVDFTTIDYTSRQGVGSRPFTPTFTYLPAITYREKQNLSTVGVYAQDQIKIDAWRITLGVRNDWLDTTFKPQSFGFAPTTYTRDDSATTFRAALGYVTPFGLAPYVSYATSFVPNPGAIQSAGGGTPQLAKPTRGEQAEIGLKYEIPAYNALISTAVFDIKQTDGLVFEASTGVNELVQLDLRSRGFEIEATASPLPGLNLIASYAYNDVEILKLSAATEGKTLNASPFHTASAFVDYTFVGGPLDRFGLGAGVRYLGSSFGDNLNTPILDNAPRAFVDAVLHYDLVALDPSLAGVRLQVNATNLLDDVQQICTAGYCYFDQSRRIVANLRYRF